LVITVTIGGSSTPLSSNLPLKSPVLKLAWRQINMFPFLLVASLIEVFFYKDFRFRDIINLGFIIKLIIFGICGNLMSFGYIWSAEYTIMSHVNIFNNLGGVIIIICCLVLRKAVHRLEIYGTLITVIGCIITLFDSDA
jgi:hypothetical protein